MSNPKDHPFPGPYKTVADFKVHQAIIGRKLAAKDDKPERQVFQLGIEGAGGKGYVDFLADAGKPEEFPSEGSTMKLLVYPPNDGYLPTAARPRPGGGFKGGGGPRFDPVEEAARQAMIIAQSARTAALEEMRLAENLRDDRGDMRPKTLQELRDCVDERVASITDQALNIGNLERLAAKERK